MDKQKQIEEMAKILCKNTSNYGNCEECGFRKGKEVFVNRICYKFDDAIELFNAGYRKIPENAVVLTMEEYDELQKGVKTHNYTAMFEAQDAYRWEQGYFQGRKETAEKFAEKVSQAIVDNTYPYFDKDGKPVNIWNAVLGFDKIDEICKEFTER